MENKMLHTTQEFYIDVNIWNFKYLKLILKDFKESNELRMKMMCEDLQHKYAKVNPQGTQFQFIFKQNGNPYVVYGRRRRSNNENCKRLTYLMLYDVYKVYPEVEQKKTKCDCF